MPIRLWITVSPGAHRNQVENGPEGFRVRIAAPATEGRANTELISFLADKLSIPKSSISILKGASGRHKLIEIEGLDEPEARRRLL